MPTLKEFEEKIKIGSAKMVCGPKAREHAQARIVAPEVLLANVLIGKQMSFRERTTDQHGGAKIEFMEKLGDKDVDLEGILLVESFHLFQHIHKPFEVFMCWANPEEVNLWWLRE